MLGDGFQSEAFNRLLVFEREWVMVASKVVYKRNQHVLSQWILRNFRSDDTATQVKDKQRVWCHTVHLNDQEENVIREIPLPISSVAVSKDCFMLIDGETNEKFDIEEELCEYEFRTASLFNKLIHGNEFQLLIDVRENACKSLDVVLDFMIIQMLLNSHNPQNKNNEKEVAFDSLVELVVVYLPNIMRDVDDPPEHMKSINDSTIYKKIKRVLRSSSEEREKAKSLVVLFFLAESKGLPVPFGWLDGLKREIFNNIYIEGVYHTGYAFDSSELRPVFSIGPNIFSYWNDNKNIYLPLSHNYAIGFSVGDKELYNKVINIYSANPALLKCKSSAQLKVYNVSHDYIDGITSIIAVGSVSMANTIYTPFELRDIHNYLALQEKDRETFYSPSEPQLTN